MEAQAARETTTDAPPPQDPPPDDSGEGRERRTGDFVVEADVYNSMLIAGKILRLVEKQKVPVSVKVKPGESVELDIAVKVLETAASGAVLATLKGLYSYLKRRRNKVTHRQARYPKTRQHIRILRVSYEVEEIMGEERPTKKKIRKGPFKL